MVRAIRSWLGRSARRRSGLEGRDRRCPTDPIQEPLENGISEKLPDQFNNLALLNLATITFTRGSAGEVTGMPISTGRVRRLALMTMGPGQ